MRCDGSAGRDPPRCPGGVISGGVGYILPPNGGAPCADPPAKDVGGGPAGGGPAAGPRAPSDTALAPVLANGADEANGLRRCVCALPPTAGLSGACDANGLGIARSAPHAGDEVPGPRGLD